MRRRVLALMTSSGADFQILATFENLGHDLKWQLSFPIVYFYFQVDVFLCKNGRWVQKKWSHCLKIKSISGMTSSMKNLGKFGDLYLIEQIQPGDPTKVWKGMPSNRNWGEESKKTSLETWKAVEDTTMAVFLNIFWQTDSAKILKSCKLTVKRNLECPIDMFSIK